MQRLQRRIARAHRGNAVEQDPVEAHCRATDYGTTTPITQLAVAGNVFHNVQGDPALITVENKELWIYQTSGDGLTDPTPLGDGDRSGMTLLTPGEANGTATLNGNATWATDSTRGKVLSLTGTTGYAATNGPALDTSKSYTVSAWVKLSSLTTNSTFVSQTDATDNANALQLYYSSGNQVWAFNRRDDDGTTGNAFTPVCCRRISQGTYGEYADAQISEVRLYNTALPLADAVSIGTTPKLAGLS